MAYVNVADWKPDQVTDWLKGIDSTISTYIQSFQNNHITGQQLLSFRPDDLEHLGISKIGHQEIILEGVEHLRSIHYELDRENLQLLAMRLSCLAHSLHNELCHSHADTQRLSTQILADIANIVTAVKPLIGWLDRPGFSGDPKYEEKRSQILSLALRMATCGQRDRFAETPVTDMKVASAELAKQADKIIQEITDPLILQPASLDLATIKKRSSDDLGFYIVPSFKGIHKISDLKLNSAAHQCGKIEPGDEIVQINYQTVVGWDVKHVMTLFTECPTEVLLTLKKRPRHTKVYGQIYVKPYRLPSKKRPAHSHPFARRPELLTHLPFRLSIQKVAVSAIKKENNPRDSRCSTSSDEEVTVQHNLVVPSKPVHRRATITGASPLSKRPPLDIHELWHDLKLEKDSDIKQSSTSVIDFEERVSSSSSKPLQPADMPKKEIEPEPLKTENLTIKQRIELFSRDDKNEKPKIPVRIVKPQIRINSEPLMDEVIIEANKLKGKESEPCKGDSKESVICVSAESVHPTVIQPLFNSSEPKVNHHVPPLSEVKEENVPASNAIVTEPLPKDTNTNDVPKASLNELVQNEEHGRVVETINKHLLFDKLNDDNDLQACDSEAVRIGKMLESLSNSLPHSARFRKGIIISDSSLSTQSLPIRRSQNVKHREFDSDLSKTISRVCKEDPYPKKEDNCSSSTTSVEQQKYNSTLDFPFAPSSMTGSLLRDKNMSKESLSQSQDLHEKVNYCDRKDTGRNIYNRDLENEVPDLSKKFNSLQEKGQKFNVRETGSENLSSRIPQERQTLPKAAPRVSASDHQRLNISTEVSPPVPPPRASLSKQPGACYRAIMAARSIGRGSPKTQRKKNLMLSKGRNVAVKDFSPVECEGWLLQRCRKGSGMWKKRWCLVHTNTIYTFINKQGTKAESLVHLPGFTVSPADEVKSRPFAFKVYHTGTTFYFAAETHFELSVWLDAITTATLAQNSNAQGGITLSESEGEESKEEMAANVGRKPPVPPTPIPRPPGPVAPPNVQAPVVTPPHNESQKKFGSLKKLGCRVGSSGNTGGGGGSSLDRKYLRLLGSGPVPVPTAQYRSYRRVHNTNTPPSSSAHTNVEHQQQNLPPEMADYRLASLTAKTTPPVPRRLIGGGSRSNETPMRPHISAPLVNPHLIQEERYNDNRFRRQPVNSQGTRERDYRDGSAEMYWVESLRRPAESNKKKNKKFQPQSHQYGAMNMHMSSMQSQYNQDSELNIVSPDYPGLEYPPVFEPGTYTLDTNAVLPRLTRQRPT